MVKVNRNGWSHLSGMAGQGRPEYARGLTGANRPATLRMNVALGKEGFPGYAGVSDGEWNKLSTKEWKAELK